MEPIGALALVVVVSGLASKAVEAVRRWRPSLDGGQVTVVAIAIGTVLAAVTDLRATADLAASWGLTLAVAVPVPVDWLITGIVAAVGAGVLADFTGRSGGIEFEPIDLQPIMEERFAAAVDSDV